MTQLFDFLDLPKNIETNRLLVNAHRLLLEKKWRAALAKTTSANLEKTKAACTAATKHLSPDFQDPSSTIIDIFTAVLLDPNLSSERTGRGLQFAYIILAALLAYKDKITQESIIPERVAWRIDLAVKKTDNDIVVLSRQAVRWLQGLQDLATEREELEKNPDTAYKIAEIDKQINQSIEQDDRGVVWVLHIKTTFRERLDQATSTVVKMMASFGIPTTHVALFFWHNNEKYKELLAKKKYPSLNAQRRYARNQLYDAVGMHDVISVWDKEKMLELFSTLERL